jgi:hypothetical protein
MKSRAEKDHRYSVSEKGRARRRAADDTYRGTVKGIARDLRRTHLRRETAIQKGH